MGYAPFRFVGERVVHRILLIYFNTERLFGDDIEIIAPNNLRGLHSNNKKHITK